VGEHVLLKRPPPTLREEGQEVKVSAKLQPKARLDVYKVIRKLGSNYVLGDVATGKEVQGIVQPVHADRLIALNVKELTTPISEANRIILEGIHVGYIMAHAVDGRVLVRFSDRTREERFHQTHKGLGTVLAESGVWLDLARFDHYFDD